ncbi:helix-turn-helix domain-containing protein [Mesorhizobium wenxiniae]|uniref:helix-turn-helix domain-containing protein n=1 Tax=Mesorhizobium wenxiniae TaxID=2014805 RepID=UPI000D52A4FD|nr:helix-turn-helix transcriptional regulator [Mesorhizobium wenxiniae]
MRERGTPSVCRRRSRSVHDLSEKCGVHRNTISAFETDQTAPNNSTLAVIRAALEAAGVISLPRMATAGGEPQEVASARYRVARRRGRHHRKQRDVGATTEVYHLIQSSIGRLARCTGS